MPREKDQMQRIQPVPSMQDRQCHLLFKVSHTSFLTLNTALIVHCREGQKLRHRNFPKGYTELLEKQHNQLVCGLQEMYQQLRRASLWEGEPLHESSGRPLTYDILAALGLLEPKQGGNEGSGIFEDFIEQPHSEMVPDEAKGARRKPPLEPHCEVNQGLSRPTPHDRAIFVDPSLSGHTPTFSSAATTSSPRIPSPHRQSRNSKLQLSSSQKFLSRPSPVGLSLGQPDTSWDDLLCCFDASQPPSNDSSDQDASWCLPTPAMLPSLVTQPSRLCHDDILREKESSYAPWPSTRNDWLDHGVAFDSSDFMSNSYQLNPQNATKIGDSRPTCSEHRR